MALIAAISSDDFLIIFIVALKTRLLRLSYDKMKNLFYYFLISLFLKFLFSFLNAGKYILAVVQILQKSLLIFFW